MPDIIAVTRDDIQHRFPCANVSFVLDAAEEAGLYLPSVCHHGRCGTCWATIVSGRYELAPFEAKAAPAAPNAVLLCRCRPQEDMVVHLPYRDAQIGRRHVPERRASIAALSTVETGWTALSLQLVPEGEYGVAAEFYPGQYVELHIPGTEIWQAAAMANLPNDDGVLEFLLPPAPDLAAAGWLAGLKRGAQIFLRGPLGRFALDEASPRPRLFIGAGAGLAPLLAMLRQLAGQRDRTRMHFIFEVAGDGQAFVEHCLAKARAALPQLTVEFTPAATAATLHAALAKLPALDVYACGPAPLLAAVAAVAAEQGVPAARLRTEPVAMAEKTSAEILTGA